MDRKVKGKSVLQAMKYI